MKINALTEEALRQIEEERGINVEVLESTLREALLLAYMKSINAAPEEAAHAHVILDLRKGECGVMAKKTVVDKATRPLAQISLEQAQADNPEAQLGDIVEIEVTPTDFGRLAAYTAKQIITQRLREAEIKAIYDECKDRKVQLVTGTVVRLESKNVIVKIGKSEAVLQASERIPGEFYRLNDRIKLFIVGERETPRGLQVVLSRANEGLVRELFKLEVPEISDGTVEIKAIAREPGYRTKVAVASTVTGVDPIGACVGMRGNRIQSIINELKGEKIDIVKWSDTLADFVAAALAPAKVNRTQVEARDASDVKVVVPEDQLSLAIGREGQNVRLAAHLTNTHIDITSEGPGRSLSSLLPIEQSSRQ